MIGTLFREIAAQHGLTVAGGMAYGMLNGCFVTLSQDTGVQRISIYVGPQEQPLPGYAQTHTVSCAQQICTTISAASGPDNLYALLTGNADIPALVLNHAGSVVTVNFPDAPEARSGIERFITELLPQVAALTRPQQCILCGQATGGEGCPVRLSSDTVVPMHAPCHKRVAGMHAPSPVQRKAQVRAILGAACGALIGAVVWALMSRLGWFAWIVAVLMGLLPTLVYDLLKGRPGKARIITIAVCAAVAVLLGSYGACLLDAHRYWADNARVLHENAIGFMAIARARFANADTGATALLTKSLIAGFAFAAIGSIACFLKKDDTSATADAEKPRRLKGKC